MRFREWCALHEDANRPLPTSLHFRRVGPVLRMSPDKVTSFYYSDALKKFVTYPSVLPK
jgi:hypothetical protein